MSVVQFVLNTEQVSVQTGQTIPKGSPLASAPVDGIPLRFRTAYPVTIWPIDVRSARFEQAPSVTIEGRDARTMLHLDLRVLGGAALSDLKEKSLDGTERPLSRLRFYLQGEGKVVHALYELLFNDALAVELRPQASAPDSAAVSL